jgi:ATP-dependent DNA ligase
MLAVSRPARLPEASRAFEPMLDGWRALAYVGEGRLTLRTRRGRTITDQVPELDGLPEQIRQCCVLDGELVTGAGLPPTSIGSSHAWPAEVITSPTPAG